MTHTPPVPPGNQSPYPIQEPPHPPAPPAPPVASSSSSSDAPDSSEGWATPEAARGWSLGRIVGAAAGIGAVAIGVAAVLFPREAPAKGKAKAAKKPKK